MSLNQIDLNLFVVFETIYTERNLTRAGEILCLSQPAVSNALSRLRQTFDDPLFIRTHKSMVPTPAADNIITRVREALVLMNNSLAKESKFLPENAEMTFRINMSDLIATMILPTLEGEIIKNSPGIDLESFHITRQNLAREFAIGAVDIAIDVPLLSDPHLCHAPLLKEKYVCMLRKDHPHKGSKLTLEEYLNLDHIHVSSRRSGQGYVEMALNKLGHRRHVQMRLQHNMVAPLVALKTDLVLTAPLGLAKQYDVRIFELPFTMPELELHIYWHKSRDKDPANKWMRQKIMEISKNRFK